MNKTWQLYNLVQWPRYCQYTILCIKYTLYRNISIFGVKTKYFLEYVDVLNRPKI